MSYRLGTAWILVLAVLASCAVAGGENAPAAEEPSLRRPRTQEEPPAGIARADEQRDDRTHVDLGDGWAPRILRGTAYQDEFERYANERFGAEDDRAREDRYLEL